MDDNEQTETTKVSITYNAVDDVQLTPAEKEEMKQLFERMINGSLDYDDLSTSNSMAKFNLRLEETFAQLRSKRTSRLWIQYLDMISLLRRFIKAERTGNWSLHLSTLSEMILYYAACGHNSYAKSAQIYLQDMLKLKDSCPNVDRMFHSGYHVIRKSDRYLRG